MRTELANSSMLKFPLPLASFYAEQVWMLKSPWGKCLLVPTDKPSLPCPSNTHFWNVSSSPLTAQQRERGAGWLSAVDPHIFFFFYTKQAQSTTATSSFPAPSRRKCIRGGGRWATQGGSPEKGVAPFQTGIAQNKLRAVNSLGSHAAARLA